MPPNHSHIARTLLAKFTVAPLNVGRDKSVPRDTAMVVRDISRAAVSTLAQTGLSIQLGSRREDVEARICFAVRDGRAWTDYLSSLDESHLEDLAVRDFLAKTAESMAFYVRHVVDPSTDEGWETVAALRPTMDYLLALGLSEAAAPLAEIVEAREDGRFEEFIERARYGRSVRKAAEPEDPEKTQNARLTLLAWAAATMERAFPALDERPSAGAPPKLFTTESNEDFGPELGEILRGSYTDTEISARALKCLWAKIEPLRKIGFASFGVVPDGTPLSEELYETRKFVLHPMPDGTGVPLLRRCARIALDPETPGAPIDAEEARLVLDRCGRGIFDFLVIREPLCGALERNDLAREFARVAAAVRSTGYRDAAGYWKNVGTVIAAFQAGELRNFKPFFDAVMRSRFYPPHRLLRMSRPIGTYADFNVWIRELRDHWKGIVGSFSAVQPVRSPFFADSYAWLHEWISAIHADLVEVARERVFARVPGSWIDAANLLATQMSRDLESLAKPRPSKRD